MKGIIYCISSNDKLYIGSTARTLKERINEHKCFDLYDMDKFNYSVKVIEEVEYTDKTELRKREQYHIDTNECVNKLRANGFTKKEYDKLYYENNRERLIKKYTEYQKSDKAKQYSKQYHHKMNKYRSTWGSLRGNNLLRISLDIFL